MQLQFNALHYFSEVPGPNTRTSGRAMQQQQVDLTCALAWSLHVIGHRLRVWTNDGLRFKELLGPEREVPLQMREVAFLNRFPPNLPFYAAHHKLDLYRFFSHESHINCLVDTDVVANPRKVEILEDTFAQANPPEAWVYDISDQVFPAFGTRRVIQDLQSLGVRHADPRWYGGEFIAATPEFFGLLNDRLESILPDYLSIGASLHHQSDESLLSPMINISRTEGGAVAEVGARGLIHRLWATRTNHSQKSSSILEQTFLWHLPNCKRELAAFSRHRNIRRLKRAAVRRRLVAEWVRRFVRARGDGS